MALTCPSYTYPTVLNGQVYTAGSTNETVIFECLSGFYMTGNKRLDCPTGGGTWPTTVPTCDIIKQYDDDDIFPSWWFYVLAAILGLLVLACFLCICCWWCCRPHNSVQPYDRYSDGGCGNGCCGTGCGGCCAGTRCGLCCMGSRCCPCCKGKGNNVSDADERRYHNVHTRSPVDNGGVYFIPANTGRPPEHHVIHSKTWPRKNAAKFTIAGGAGADPVRSSHGQGYYVLKNGHQHQNGDKGSMTSTKVKVADPKASGAYMYVMNPTHGMKGTTTHGGARSQATGKANDAGPAFHTLDPMTVTEQPSDPAYVMMSEDGAPSCECPECRDLPPTTRQPAAVVTTMPAPTSASSDPGIVPPKGWVVVQDRGQFQDGEHMEEVDLDVLENGSGGPNGFYVYQTKDLPRVHVKDQSTNTTDNKRKPINEPHQETETSPNNGANATYLSTYATSNGNAKPNNQLGKSNGPVAKSNGYVANPNGYVAHPANDDDDDDVARGTAPYDTRNKNNREPNAWANNKTPRESQPHASNGPYRDSKAWKDNSNSETRSDGDMMDNAAKSKKPAREVKAWLPHSHGIRNINTSTK